MDPLTGTLLGVGMSAIGGGLFNKGPKPPKYNMSPEYRSMTLGTAYPKVTEGISSGGFGIDTAGLERRTRENIAANYGGAYQKARAFTTPYGNVAAGNRMAERIATQQALAESGAIGDIRTRAEEGRIANLMNLLGIATGAEDPAYRQYYADIQRYGANLENRQVQASLMGDLAMLGTIGYLNGGRRPDPLDPNYGRTYTTPGGFLVGIPQVGGP